METWLSTRSSQVWLYSDFQWKFLSAFKFSHRIPIRGTLLSCRQIISHVEIELHSSIKGY